MCIRDSPDALIEEILKYHHGPKVRLVDVGCGTGIATVLFKDKFQEIIGVDPSESMLEAFKHEIDKSVAPNDRNKFKLIASPLSLIHI